MRFRFWCRQPVATPQPTPPPAAVPSTRNERSTWAQPTAVFPTAGPGRPGKLTPAQRWRGNGGR